MQIGDSNNSLQIEMRERVLEPRPDAGDLRIGVTVLSNGFSGKYDEIWLHHHEFVEFVGDFERMERERRGSARLCSMSPGEFIVDFRPSDSLGHFEIEAQLCRYVYGSETQSVNRVVGFIEVDPSHLSSILREFRTWLAATN